MKEIEGLTENGLNEKEGPTEIEGLTKKVKLTEIEGLNETE